MIKQPKRYKQVRSGEWQMPVMKNYFMKCCDCGLVHRMNFKVIDEETQKTVKGKRVLIQAFRVK